MGKPTIRNGIVRAIKEIAIPSVTILLAVVYSRSTWDEVVAGIVFVVLTTVALGIIYKSSKYWTVTYTTGFAFTALVLVFVTPDIIAQLIHPAFQYLGTIIVGGFVVLMVRRFARKTGII